MAVRKTHGVLLGYSCLTDGGRLFEGVAQVLKDLSCFRMIVVGPANVNIESLLKDAELDLLFENDFVVRKCREGMHALSLPAEQIVLVASCSAWVKISEKLDLPLIAVGGESDDSDSCTITRISELSDLNSDIVRAAFDDADTL